MKRIKTLPPPAVLLAETGRAMTQARGSNALHTLLVDAAQGLCAPRRTLLLLESPTGLRLVRSKLPRGEDAAALLVAVTPWLSAARKGGATVMHIGPRGALPVDQRCCIVAPLIAPQGTLGFLYCDIEGRFGRWSDSERQLMAVLAALGAILQAD